MTTLVLEPEVTRAPPAVARGSWGDGVLDALLFAFAGWTIVYHAAVLAGWTTTAALALWTPLLLASGLALRPRRQPDDCRADGSFPHLHVNRRVVRVGGVALAVVCAVLFAFATPRWGIVWLAWIGAAGCGLVWLLAREATDPGPRRPEWTERAVTLGWVLALAALALLILNPDDDDAWYAHFSAWIGAHGTFPTRDILFSNQTLPAVYYPPAAAWEPLVGSLSRLTGITSPHMLYLVLGPFAAGLSALALRRLLRSWAVPMPAVALSVAMAFLFALSTGNKTLGAFWIGRIWQGKVVLAVVLAPLLMALLHDYGRRPSRARAARLGAAGIAGVGLSTTGIFLVPVIALGAMAPLAVRSWRAALAGFAATAVYPLATGVATLALGGRNPEHYQDADAASGPLPHFALGVHGVAFVAVAAMLIAPVLIPRPLAARMTAATVLLVGLLYAPRVPLLIFHATDLGRVLWRLVWAMPVAALVGTLAVRVVRPEWPLLARLAPAIVLAAALAVVGTAPWADQSARGLHWPPVIKRFPEEVSAARTALQVAGRDDTILAPSKLSETLGVMSGDVFTVDPRTYFVNALAGTPGAHATERKRLQVAANAGLRNPPGTPENAAGMRLLQSDLRVVGVDEVCLPGQRAGILRGLQAAGWRRASASSLVTCLRD